MKPTMSEKSVPRKNRKRQSFRNILLNGPDLVMNASIGIFQSTPEGRFLSVNPSLARMYGYETPEEIVEAISDIGRQLHFCAAGRETFRQILEAHGRVDNFEYKACRRGGSVFGRPKMPGLSEIMKETFFINRILQQTLPIVNGLKRHCVKAKSVIACCLNILPLAFFILTSTVSLSTAMTTLSGLSAHQKKC